MMHGYFKNLADGVAARLAAGTSDTVARKTLALEVARLGVRLFAGDERVAWCGVMAPFDLLAAHGITSCFVEFVGAMLASSGVAEPLLGHAEDAGHSTDSCSYHRAVTGASLEGMIPVPDFMVGTSAPCAGGLAVIESLAGRFERDLYVIQVPQRDDPAAVAYVADQLRGLSAFVANKTGAPLDKARLRRAVEYTNEARALLLEVYELAASVPTPARRRDLVNFSLLLAVLMGSEAAVRVARAYRDEFRAKVAAGRGGHAAETVRLLWIQNRIQFKHPLEKFLEDDLGAAVVVDELNDISWDPIDPDDPYPAMARRLLSIPLTGAVDRRIAQLQRLARQYRVDGAINPCHWGCRQGSGSRGLLERGLAAVGVPVLNLEVDCCDQRQFAEGQLRTRLEAFVEMLQGAPGAVARRGGDDG